MTGYGRFEGVIEGRQITVEIKSVNHRYFEFSSRITRGYGFFFFFFKDKCASEGSIWTISY